MSHKNIFPAPVSRRIVVCISDQFGIVFARWKNKHAGEKDKDLRSTKSFISGVKLFYVLSKTLKNM